MQRARDSAITKLLEDGAAAIRLSAIELSVGNDNLMRFVKGEPSLSQAGEKQESIGRLFSELESGIGSPQAIQEYRAFSKMYGQISQQMKQQKCPQVTP